MLSHSGSLYVLDTNSLSDIWWQNSSPILWIVFSLIDDTICRTKVFNFDALQFIFSFFFLVLLVSYLRNHCLTQGYEDLPQCFILTFYRFVFYILYKCAFSIELPLLLCQRSVDYICVGLFWDSLFCSIDLCVYMLTNTTLSWLL